MGNLYYVGGFYLYFLLFPFIYQFNSRIGFLLCSSFENDYREFLPYANFITANFVTAVFQLLQELEANLLDQNVHELEFELSRM